EFLSRIQQTDVTAPVKDGGYWYYTRTVEGKQYPIHCRKAGSLDAEEQILLDLNELAKDHKFYSVNVRTVSDDGNLMAFTDDITGCREYTLRIKDLRTGKLLPDKLTKVDSVVWGSDNRMLYYVTEDEAKRPYRLWRHRLGDGQEQDTLLHEEKDELYDIDVARSRDRKYVFLNLFSYDNTEVRYLRRDEPNDALQVVVPRQEGHRYDVEHRGGLFYIRTNKDAKNFRLVTAPVATPDFKHWQELIPHRPEVLLDRVHPFAGHVVLAERYDGLDRIVIFDPQTKKRTEVAFDEPTFALGASANPEFDATTFRF